MREGASQDQRDRVATVSAGAPRARGSRSADGGGPTRAARATSGSSTRRPSLPVGSTSPGWKWTMMRSNAAPRRAASRNTRPSENGTRTSPSPSGGEIAGDGVTLRTQALGLRVRVGPDPAMTWGVGRNDGDPHRTTSLAAVAIATLGGGPDRVSPPDRSTRGAGTRSSPGTSSASGAAPAPASTPIRARASGGTRARGAGRPPTCRTTRPTPIMIRADGTASACRAIHRSCFGAPKPTRTIAGEVAATARVSSRSRSAGRTTPSSEIEVPAPATAMRTPGRLAAIGRRRAPPRRRRLRRRRR